MVCIKSNSLYSRKQEVTCCIPQVSCLGSIPFILYASDFEKFQSVSCLNTYAADTSNFSSNEDPLQLLEYLKRR